MKLKVTAHDFKVTEGIEAHLTDKLAKVEKFDVEVVNVRLLNDGKNKKVNIGTVVNKKSIEVKESHEDLYSAIDAAVNSLEKVIAKQKDKILSKRRKHKGEKGTKDLGLEFVKDEKLKRHEVASKPMSEEEAILQIEALDHNFLLFHNTDTETICVIYENENGEFVLFDTDKKSDSDIDFNILT